MSGFKVNTRLKDEIIRLKDIVGLTFKDVGGQLGIASGTVKTHYYLAKGQATARIPDSPYPRYNSPPTIEGDALILPDCEIPFHHAEFINRVLDLADAWKIRQMIAAGDLLHFDSLSGWEPNWKKKSNGGLTSDTEKQLIDFAITLPKNQQQRLIDKIVSIGTAEEERGYSMEMHHARNTLNELNKCFDKNVWILGNHECLDSETEVFADGEWKQYTELIPNKSKVLVFNDGVISYETIQALHEYDHNGIMYKTKTMLTDFMVSQNHRILWHPKLGKWRYEKAEDLYLKNKNTRLYFPLAGKMNCKGSMLSDDEIKIAGWIYTDCTIGRNNYYQFTQRKSKHHLITQILKRLNISFGIYERERNTEVICGRKLLKKPENEITISANAEGSRYLQTIVSDKNSIADWIWDLDDRQFDLFLYEYINGDGSIHKDYPTSLMIYCNREKLAGQLQTLCIIHGYRATISRYNGNNIRINIVKRNTLSLDGGYRSNTKAVNYSGKIWCATVPSENFLVRRNGRPIFTGNSRLMRTINSPLEPSELLNLMHLDNGKWSIAPYYHCLLNTSQGVFRITHPKGAANGTARGLASQYFQHIIMGHSHKMFFDWDVSGKYYAIQMGHTVDEERLCYVAQRDAKRDSHKLGAVIVRDGYPYLITEQFDFERMKKL